MHRREPVRIVAREIPSRRVSLFGEKWDTRCSRPGIHSRTYLHSQKGIDVTGGADFFVQSTVALIDGRRNRFQGARLIEFRGGRAINSRQSGR